MKVNDYFRKTQNTLRKHGIGEVFRKSAAHVRRALRKYSFSPYTIKKTVQGETVDFYIGDVIGEEWYTQLAPDVPELAWLKGHLRPGDWVADCGAHHGMISLLMGRWVGPEGRVVSFEANPVNAEIVKKNMDLNAQTNVEVRQQAVGRNEGVLHFTLDSNGAVTDDRSSSTIEVPVVNLDAIFPDRKPDFVKIDVEGHEIEVLKGATQVMATAPGLNIEVHCIMFDRPKEKVAELLGLLKLERYDTWIMLEYYETPVPFDPAQHTPDFIVGFDKVNLFCIPKHRGA